MDLVIVQPLPQSPPAVAVPAGIPADAIAYAIADSALGRVLVARSAVGVCAILLGDNDDALEDDLAERFPGVRLILSEAAVADDMAKVIRFAESPTDVSELPLDLCGTPFQRRVWDALRIIPAGQTVSYAELARMIGSPGATRAVATACAANRLAMLVPCHRVVRSNGALAGYRWGVERKRALLEREAAA